jgi:hypothetical protein
LSSSSIFSASWSRLNPEIQVEVSINNLKEINLLEKDLSQTIPFRPDSFSEREVIIRKRAKFLLDLKAIYFNNSELSMVYFIQIKGKSFKKERPVPQ